MIILLLKIVRASNDISSTKYAKFDDISKNMSRIYTADEFEYLSVRKKMTKQDKILMKSSVYSLESTALAEHMSTMFLDNGCFMLNIGRLEERFQAEVAKHANVLHNRIPGAELRMQTENEALLRLAVSNFTSQISVCSAYSYIFSVNST